MTKASLASEWSKNSNREGHSPLQCRSETSPCLSHLMEIPADDRERQRSLMAMTFESIENWGNTQNTFYLMRKSLTVSPKFSTSSC